MSLARGWQGVGHRTRSAPWLHPPHMARRANSCQRSRAYEWDKAGINPVTHVFGAKDKDGYRDGVRKALQPALDQTAQVRSPPPSLLCHLINQSRAASRWRRGDPEA